MCVHLEAVCCHHFFGQVLHRATVDLDHRAALVADSVVVIVARQVICRAPVSEVHVADDTHVLQCLEGSVDRRHVHAGIDRTRVSGQRFSIGVVRRTNERRENCAARRCDASARGSDSIDDFVDQVSAQGC